MTENTHPLYLAGQAVKPAAPVVKVGDPASIRLYTDTIAAVVVRVTPKTVVVARVQTGPSAPDMACDEGAYGIRPARAEGILSAPIAGTEQRFTMTKRGRYEHDGLVLILGRSVTWTDYRL